MKFLSNDIKLEEGFEWATRQALEYVFENDIVGKWYEAALPERASFCMRDVAHHANGAFWLGLKEHTKNMLYKFCENISENRDWCTYWEIDKNNRPTEIDYANDSDFWYNLPANFDIIDCCYRMFLLSGDRSYIEDEVFINFYEKTFNEFISKWDLNGDGIPKGLPHYGRRGIASYDEGDYSETILVGCDLLCIMFRGYSSYVEILKLRDESNKKIEKYCNISKKYFDMLNSEWWDANLKKYKFGKGQNGAFLDEDINNFIVVYMAMYNKVPDDCEKVKYMLINMLNDKEPIVECLSHFSEIFYNYNDAFNGYNYLLKVIEPNLYRRDYPEVSFATVGAYVSGLMGITVNVNLEIQIMSKLFYDTQQCSLKNVVVLNNELDVEHVGLNCTSVRNIKGNDMEISVSFLGHYENITCNGSNLVVQYTKDILYNSISTVKVKVLASEKIVIKAHY